MAHRAHRAGEGWWAGRRRQYWPRCPPPRRHSHHGLHSHQCGQVPSEALESWAVLVSPSPSYSRPRHLVGSELAGAVEGMVCLCALTPQREGVQGPRHLIQSPLHPGDRPCCVHLLNLYVGKLRPPGTGHVHLMHVQTRAGQALHVKGTLGLGGVG